MSASPLAAATLVVALWSSSGLKAALGSPTPVPPHFVDICEDDSCADELQLLQTSISLRTKVDRSNRRSISIEETSDAAALPPGVAGPLFALREEHVVSPPALSPIARLGGTSGGAHVVREATSGWAVSPPALSPTSRLGETGVTHVVQETTGSWATPVTNGGSEGAASLPQGDQIGSHARGRDEKAESLTDGITVEREKISSASVDLDTIVGSQESPSEVSGASTDFTDRGHAEGCGGVFLGFRRGYLVLFFFFGTLMISSLTLWILERCAPSVPYTVALFAIGVVLSCLQQTLWKEGDGGEWSSWRTSVNMWHHIDPHLLFYFFLPGLIFGEAMRMNMQLMARHFWQVLFMAGPGVLVGTCLIAGFCKALLPYNWDWPTCLIFGAILSATDSMSLTGSRARKVPPRLALLMSGESLIGDGTSMLVFALVLKVSLGATLTPLSVFTYFANMTGTAVVFGAVLSVVTLLFMGRCSGGKYNSDAMIQVVVTVSCGYLAFFFAESELSTSGVIASITFGVVITNYVWPHVLSTDAMHTVWDAIEFVGNTVIFFLAGLIFGEICMEQGTRIGGSDMLYLCLLYVASMVVRTLVVACLWPMLNCLGMALSWQEVVVVAWGGLRGAVGLAMAIIVDLQPGVRREIGTSVMFFIGGVVALTILGNAAALGWLLPRLDRGQDKSPTNTRLLGHLQTELANQIRDAYTQNVSSKDALTFGGARAEVVQEMVPVLRGKEPEVLTCADHEGAAVSGQSLVISYRKVLLRNVRNHYKALMKAGVVPRTSRVARALIASAEEALDFCESGISDWAFIQRHFSADHCGSLRRFVAHLVHLRPFRWSAAFRRAFSLEDMSLRLIYASIFFMEAHELSRGELPKLFTTSDAVDELVQQQVSHESLLACQQANEYLNQLSGEVVQIAKSHILARKLLMVQVEQVSFLLDKGVISESEVAAFEQHARVELHKPLPPHVPAKGSSVASCTREPS